MRYLRLALGTVLVLITLLYLVVGVPSVIATIRECAGHAIDRFPKSWRPGMRWACGHDLRQEAEGLGFTAVMSIGAFLLLWHRVKRPDQAERANPSTDILTT
jgi:hypothetical protein